MNSSPYTNKHTNILYRHKQKSRLQHRYKRNRAVQSDTNGIEINRWKLKPPESVTVYFECFCLFVSIPFEINKMNFWLNCHAQLSQKIMSYSMSLHRMFTEKHHYNHHNHHYNRPTTIVECEPTKFKSHLHGIATALQSKLSKETYELCEFYLHCRKNDGPKCKLKWNDNECIKTGETG